MYNVIIKKEKKRDNGWPHLRYINSYALDTTYVLHVVLFVSSI